MSVRVRFRHLAGPEKNRIDDVRLPALLGSAPEADVRAEGAALHHARVFERDGEIAGALPGLLSRVGRVKIFGSPREGCQTVSMGPVFDEARVALSDLLAALVPYLEQQHGVKHVEMMQLGLDAAAFRAAGFEGQQVFTYRSALTPGDEAATFKSFKESARRNVRRAERLGLHGQRRSDQHRGHDEQRIERHREEVDEDRDQRDSAKAPDQDRHEPDADGELQTAVIPEHARRPGTTGRCEHDCGNRSE